MIIPIARLFCPDCFREQIFEVIAESSATLDPAAAMCPICGFQFGDEGYVVVDTVGPNGQRVASIRPALDPQVLAEAMASWRAEAAARLLAAGGSPARASAEARLEHALSQDIGERRGLLATAGAQATLDPALASRILDPRRGNDS